MSNNATAKNLGIDSLNELNDYEVLRAFYANSTFKPKVTFNYENISFNKACVELLPNTQYVNVLVDRTKHRIVILPVKRHSKDALKWCNIKKGEIIKRTCMARKFGEKLYDMMKWTKENRYRVFAFYQLIDGVQLLVFNLEECEIIVPEYVTTKTGKLVKRGRIYLPEEWKSSFGMKLNEHNDSNHVELNAHYTLSDKDKEVTINDVKIVGKIPTEEEIIMSQYRGEKTEEESVNV